MKHLPRSYTSNCFLPVMSRLLKIGVCGAILLCFNVHQTRKKTHIGAFRERLLNASPALIIKLIDTSLAPILKHINAIGVFVES